MQQEDIAPGTVLDGSIRIEEIAGRGGSSTVYRATDLGTGHQLAVKVLTATDSSSRRRLAREAELLARVNHPAIVPFRGFRQLGESNLLITDWVNGESLLDRRRRAGPVPVDEALAILQALAEPLDHLHELDIVHRDISPANVIVRPDNTLTIIDLGIGHHIDSRTMTSEDMLAGTPKYLAPELIRGERATGRADQYSVGVMVHELITGQSPFPAADKVATALHHQLYSVPVPLDEVEPHVPSRLADAVLRSLQKDPDDRFRSVSEFAALAAGAADVGADRPHRHDHGHGHLEDQIHSREAAGSRGTWRRTAWLVGGGLLVLGALAVAGYVAAFGDGPTSDLADSGLTAAEPVDGSGGESGTTLVIQTEQPTVNAGDAGADSGTAGSDPEPDSAAPGSTGWEDGTAARLPCNLLQGATFANGSVPTDYFGDPPGRERVVTDVGFDGSWALEVGRPNAFGQYGEIVAVEPGTVYIFSAWLYHLQQIESAEMGISFLTTDYQPMTTGGQEFIPSGPADFLDVVAEPAPHGAGFAVPYLFKDSSVGVLIADELVFGPAQTCVEQIEQVGR